MSGIWRSALLFLIARKFQPWLIAGGIALLAAAKLLDASNLAAIAGGGSSSANWVPLGCRMLAANCLGGSLGVGVMSIRRILAIRTLTLIPRARIQLLLGLLLAPLLVVLCAAPLVAWSVGMLWASATLFVIWVFVMSRSVWIGLATLAIPLVVPPRYLWLLHSILVPHDGVDALGYVALAAAVIFVVWYARAPAILAPLENWQGIFARRPPSPRHSRLNPGMSPRVAIDTLLLGHASKFHALREYFPPILVANLAMLLIGIFPWLLLHRPISATLYEFAPVALLCTLGLQGLRLAARIAGGSRRAWIVGHRTRAQLFSTAERLGWQCFGLLALPVIVVYALERSIATHVHAPARGPWIFAQGPELPALLLEMACCGFYLGLASVGGKSQADRSALAWLAISWVAVFFPTFVPLAPQTRSAAAWAVQVSLLLSALALRSVAAMRWRRFDWLGRAPVRAVLGRSR